MRKPDVDLAALRRLVARAVPGSGRPTIERTADGVSTQVYRIRGDERTFYLRVAEEQADSLAPEALIHQRLRDRGVKVPEVVHFEPYDDALERSVLITTEVAGRPLALDHETDVRAILVAAGRDLALINEIGVAGFGWIRRDRPAAGRLEAELPTHRSFVLDGLEVNLDLLRRHFFADDEIEAIRRALTEDDAWLDNAHAHLVHGDFDLTHVFHQGGEYTGIIDFGEIRGADRLYDLGHFALHDGDWLPVPVLPHLMEGYRTVAPMPDDHLARTNRNALLIGVGRLARSVGRPGVAAYQDRMTSAIRRCLRMVTS